MPDVRTAIAEKLQHIGQKLYGLRPFPPEAIGARVLDVGSILHAQKYSALLKNMGTAAVANTVIARLQNMEPITSLTVQRPRITFAKRQRVIAWMLQDDGFERRQASAVSTIQDLAPGSRLVIHQPIGRIVVGRIPTAELPPEAFSGIMRQMHDFIPAGTSLPVEPGKVRVLYNPPERY